MATLVVIGNVRLSITRLFSFEELEDEAKEKARDWYREQGGLLDYEWWDCLYEDAKNIGVKITAFDLSRSTIKGELLQSPTKICCAIIEQHGATCDTYKLAQRYFKSKHEHKTDTREEFLQQILEEYLSMLRKEVEHLESDESVDETLCANDYAFDEQGKRVE